MSTHSEHSDSDSNNSNSWILLDDDKGKADEEKEQDEPRQTVEDVPEFEDSDGISIISDPEEIQIETNESASESTAKSEEEIAPSTGKELVKLEPKPAKTSGSVTSALFMIAGLLIALYFQTGCEEEITAASKIQYNTIKTSNLVHEPSKFKAVNDDQYVSSYGKGNKRNVDDVHYHKQRKDYDKKSQYEGTSKGNNIKDKYYKKFKDSDDSSEEKDYKKKYYGSHESDYKHNKKTNKLKEHEARREHSLKQKDDKLSMHSKDSREYDKQYKQGYRKDKYNKYNKSMSGEWYGKMHKGRNEMRNNERKSEWVFDRAQIRDKKRDKAHWYFNWMDDREDVRVHRG